MPRAERADAQRNRAAILDVATAALAENGATSLNEIAKRAGVGPGTLYRHFPSRDALLLAVYARDVGRLCRTVDAVLRRHSDDPLAAFRYWCEKLTVLVRLKRGLGEALISPEAQTVVNDTYLPVTRAIGQLLEAGERAGVLRPGLDAADVLMLIGFLWRVPDTRAGRAQAARLMDLTLTGLTPRDSRGNDVLDP